MIGKQEEAKPAIHELIQTDQVDQMQFLNIIERDIEFNNRVWNVLIAWYCPDAGLLQGWDGKLDANTIPTMTDLDCI